ncbi:MAG: hypothetical protein K2M10_07270 [Muribaculaceae bacterium]|nr:hypothetical protein [Muribaculaceae bacterium]
MKKSLLTGMLLLAAASMSAADEPTYNFFDPADCDADGWLWLDTPEKIAKYVGPGKKIQLLNASYEIDDPDFPGDKITPVTKVDAAVKGYNNKGEQGGEGSKTGGIILPASQKDWSVATGGGVLIQMPDCAIFDVYVSQSQPKVYTWIDGGYGYLSAKDLLYIWNYDDPMFDWQDDIAPLSTDYVGWDMNVQDLKYYYYDDKPEFCIYGAKGNPRTVGYYNDSECEMYLQGIRIKTYTDVSKDDSALDPAPEGTFNFFDPEDCDANGWLWLDTPEKIEKYIGEDKKIQLLNASYEIDDPDFPGDKITPLTKVDAAIKGYNNKGEQGGEGSKTGGIILPASQKDWSVATGGGVLIQMPDCAIFDVYVSQSQPKVYTWIDGGYGYLSAKDLLYIWNYDDPMFDWQDDIAPLSTDYVGWDMNVQDLKYYYYDDKPEFCIYGAKGNPRTVGYYNDSECEMYLQGLRIRTFTDVSLDDTSVKTVIADTDLKIAGKVITVSSPADIFVYDIAGRIAASAYGTSLDCSALKGIYIVRAAGKVAKVRF